jgi:hypothetical protein
MIAVRDKIIQGLANTLAQDDLLSVPLLRTDEAMWHHRQQSSLWIPDLKAFAFQRIPRHAMRAGPNSSDPPRIDAVDRGHACCRSRQVLVPTADRSRQLRHHLRRKRLAQWFHLVSPTFRSALDFAGRLCLAAAGLALCVVVVETFRIGTSRHWEDEWELAEGSDLSSSGILNWLLDGLRTWCDKGLHEPDDVVQATAEYRSASDPLGRFLATCVVESAGDRVQSSVLHEVYEGLVQGVRREGLVGPRAVDGDG